MVFLLSFYLFSFGDNIFTFFLYCWNKRSFTTLTIIFLKVWPVTFGILKSTQNHFVNIHETFLGSTMPQSAVCKPRSRMSCRQKTDAQS